MGLSPFALLDLLFELFLVQTNLLCMNADPLAFYEEDGSNIYHSLHYHTIGSARIGWFIKITRPYPGSVFTHSFTDIIFLMLERMVYHIGLGFPYRMYYDLIQPQTKHYYCSPPKRESTYLQSISPGSLEIC